MLPGDNSAPPEDILVFSNEGETLHVLLGYKEPMFLVDDIERIALLDDRQKDIQTAQGINSTMFITCKVNHEDFEDKQYLFTNLQGASAMAMSKWDDNMFLGGFGFNALCDFLDATIFQDDKQG